MKKLFLMIGLFTLILSLSACSKGTTDNAPVVYITVYPMAFLVEEIAGDTVTVKQVPGVVSHSDSVDWSAKEIIDMINADLLIYIHAGADNYIPNNAETFADGNVELIDMSQHVQYNVVCYTHTLEDGTDTSVDNCDSNMLNEDPHFWLDPVRMAEAAAFLKDKLIATYPENEELYNNNYTVLSSSLEKLDQDFQEMADAATKPIITTVMLFTYFSDRYGIEIQSLTIDAHSTESNPTDLIDILNMAIANDIHYILFEKNANSPAGDQMLTDLQDTYSDASALYLHGLGQITDQEKANGSTYLSIMYDNLTALDTATK